MLRAMHLEFPEMEFIQQDRAFLESALDAEHPCWTDNFTNSIIQINFKWINPDIISRSFNFVYALDQICRENLPVIHLGSAFDGTVSRKSSNRVLTVFEFL